MASFRSNGSLDEDDSQSISATALSVLLALCPAVVPLGTVVEVCSAMKDLAWAYQTHDCCQIARRVSMVAALMG